MAARIKTKPKKQGELDGACGFYAITNAINILEPDLSPNEIFKTTLESFFIDGDPMRVLNGTTRGNLKNIISRTIDCINNCYFLTQNDGTPYSFTFEIPYWHYTKQRDRKEVIDTLRNANHKLGSVVIMGYQFSKGNSAPSYAHWTVVRDTTEDALIIHDSSNEKNNILYSEIRIDGSQTTHTGRPFNIFSSDIFLIRKT
jgi:hypothetical protein